MENKEFQETAQPERSQTSNRARVTCIKCEQEFETFLRQVDGKTIPVTYVCRDCQLKEREAEYRAAAEKKLAVAIEETRELWMEQSGIPGKFISKSFSNFKRELQPRAFDAVWRYFKEGKYQWDDEADVNYHLL